MDRKNNYTISDIAEELGVSKTTVSRALSGKGRIGKETKEKILTLASEHNYRPNVQARGLAQSRTYNIGLMMPFDYSVFDFPFFKECMLGICEKASMYNYDVVLTVADGQDFSGTSRLADNRKVDGMILTRTTADSISVQKYLKEKQMPFVVVGPSEEGVVWVDNQNREGSCELTSVMLWKGMEKLALLGGSRTHLVTQSRLQGFLDAHQERGAVVDESLIFFDVDNFPAITEALDRIMEKGADGIVCMDDHIASMLLSALRERDIRVPQDIRIASMYDNAKFETFSPTVTSLHFNTRGLGQNACLTLLNLLGEEIKEEQTILNYQVVLRDSTK